ncbi:hypothetical protein ACFOQM_17815 [Paenibacillus sp. GCM10012307]|uniref:Uncharacterized protein n=1 Tax=Paenibacillus roseus TaxID=2798579 RepID=A0A934J9U4_9BACL|nr:hypothetical protein [Paenibacillus roseus]MBJ6363082.1 hypothetical protein [Paenibacillus roseus]
MKKKHSFKWAIIGAAIAIVLVFGIETASTGIENVYGPVKQPSASSVAGLVPESRYQQDAAPVSRQPIYGPYVQQETSNAGRYAPIQERMPGIYGEYREPAVNRVADQTAGVLQSLSSSGIRFVVSLFDSITN